MTDAQLKSLAENEVRRRQAIRDAQRRLEAGDGFIYAADLRDGTVKIGCALDIRKRMGGIRADFCLSFTPDVIGFVRGSLSEERWLHCQLRRSLKKSRHGPRSEVYPRSILLHPAIPEGLRVMP